MYSTSSYTFGNVTVSMHVISITVIDNYVYYQHAYGLLAVMFVIDNDVYYYHAILFAVQLQLAYMLFAVLYTTSSYIIGIVFTVSMDSISSTVCCSQ